ncbi:MAG: bifunctional 2-C-methyl-D-erythritol 4-phosphate cytidylyltransferase/2-C-methyl-D-erythritol 2,4-cyclodiphosphate synthase [Devosiaceae bacterium]|nr:bifunctional 2-C-methyl-D-erythritol 4-phosphate cytidylyltransferase/2-C-methyl-D-erythritol 2,4-cyclodiphosphate synthase [Devosiaceae bacterium MH13]
MEPHSTSTLLSNQSHYRTCGWSCVVVAAGSGSRARAHTADIPKQFQLLAGQPLIAHTVRALAAHPQLTELVIVVSTDDAREGKTQAILSQVLGAELPMRFVAGGETRRQSVLAGIRALAGLQTAGPVLVHDGARPFVDPQLIDRILAALQTASGAIPVVPVTDTLKKTDDNQLTSGPSRSNLVTVQTPQGFDGNVLLAAHEALDKAIARGDCSEDQFTDDASVLEWNGQTSVGVPSDTKNIKITVPEDWARAEALMSNMDGALPARATETRSGFGYDVHRLVPGDGVWLCGHFIEHSARLDGHSDADVGLHALTDALLGAIGAGDIGTHFPPSDPQWKGAASHQFARHAAQLVAKRDGRIVNVDVAIVAEAPKVGPHRAAMVAKMAEMLGVSESRVSVKATTNERMGFAGRQEGIAAFATASVELPRND